MTEQNRERFERLQELFEQAIELPAAERRPFLESSCAADEDLLRDALGILATEDDDEVLLEPLAAHLEPPAEGRTIGRYRLLDELGTGGMGTVYVAERADEEFDKRVAVKVMSSRLLESRLVERFRSERQILAALEHPYIARLIDGGTLADGRPYLVMELVEGETITRYCDERGLSVERRIELFAKVCEAVQHAHRNLIVHRDIKPSNILVSEDGTPKLLDFGIAKLIEDAPLELTATHHRAFSPDYASPEQIQGGPITTATDVYALGALLYELLTGERPHARSSSSLAEIERSITESVPERPSARLQEQPQRAKRLRGDLDTIVLKALRKEPERRYSNAAALVEDLERHLQGLPVLARPDSFRYRALKFARRNRTLIFAAAVALSTLLVATVVSLRFAYQANRQRLEAERQAEIAKAVNDFLNEDLLAKSSPYQQPDRDLTLREAIDLSAEAARERFEGQPLVEAAIRLTLGHAYEGLGELRKASRQYDRAFELRQRSLGIENPETLEARLAQINGLYLVGRFEEGLDRAEELTAMCGRLLGRDHRLTAQALALQALFSGSTGDPWKEIELFELAVDAHRRAFGDQHPTTLRVLNDLAISYDDLGRNDEARVLFEEVLEARLRVLPDRHPDTMLTKISLGTNAMYSGRLDEAEQIFVEAMVEMEPVLGAEHVLCTATLGLLGRVYQRQGHLERALDTAERVLEVQLRTLPLQATELTRSRVTVMALYSQLGRHEEAIGIARSLLEEKRKSGGGRLRPALARLANELRAAGRCQEALPLVAEADPESPARQVLQDTGTLFAVRGLCAYERRELEPARQDLERSFELLEPEVGLAPPLVQQVSETLMEIYERTDDEAAAAAHRERLAE